MNIRHLSICTPRDPDWIEPGSEQHRAMISPSKIGAILGLSRWESPFSLWHRMRGDIGAQPPKDAFDIGHDAEPFAANRWRRRNPGWRLSPGEVQFVVDPQHFGFPAIATLDRRAVRGRSRRVVEFKVARDQYDIEVWGDDLSGDPPADYFVQVLTAMLFTGWTQQPGHLLCLGPTYRERVYEVAYDAATRDEAALIIDECRRFYDSLSGDIPPALDKSVATYQCIKELHPEIDGTTIELDPDEALAYAQARTDYAAAEDALQLESNRLLKRMEQARYAELGGVQIARRQPSSKGGVSFYPSKTITPDKILQLTGEPTE